MIGSLKLRTYPHGLYYHRTLNKQKVMQSHDSVSGHARNRTNQTTLCVVLKEAIIMRALNRPIRWLVSGLIWTGWCWFIVREKHCWLASLGWLKPTNEHGDLLCPIVLHA